MARPQGHRRQQRVREAAPARFSPASPRREVTGILLDSDVIIDALRGRRTTIDEIVAVEREGVPTYCCAIAWAEIFAGLRPGEEAMTEGFFHARGEVVIDGGREVLRAVGRSMTAGCRGLSQGRPRDLSDFSDGAKNVAPDTARV